MAVGGALALSGQELKQILAHSTISQYGYVVSMLGVGGPAGAAAACFYVLAHALAKSALFMTAGAVTEATGEKRLDAARRLQGRVPWGSPRCWPRARSAVTAPSPRARCSSWRF